MTLFFCPFCGDDLPDAHSAHCGEVGHAVDKGDVVLAVFEDGKHCVDCRFHQEDSDPRDRGRGAPIETAYTCLAMESYDLTPEDCPGYEAFCDRAIPHSIKATRKTP